MKKRIFSRALALLMALSLLSTTAFAASFTDLQNAINGENETIESPNYISDSGRYGYGNQGDTGYEIEAWTQDGTRNVQLNGTVSHTNNTESPIQITDKNVTLDLNGNTIRGAGKHPSYQGSAITVTGEEASLTLKDSKNGGAISGDNASQTAEGVIVDGGASFTMESGAITGFGGGHHGVNVKNGTFTMESGEITNNSRGGVTIDGANSSFTMNGGNISQNKSNANGGGVSVSNGATFTMNKGEITQNTANGTGGGVNADRATFNMTGGNITSNVAGSGGGIYGNSANISLKAGVGKEINISENTGKNNGGGIMATSGTLDIDGVIMERNIANGVGGAMFINGNGSAVNIGNTTMKNNSANSGGSAMRLMHREFNISNATMVKENASSDFALSIGKAKVNLEGTTAISGSGILVGEGSSLGMAESITMEGGTVYLNSGCPFSSNGFNLTLDEDNNLTITDSEGNAVNAILDGTDKRFEAGKQDTEKNEWGGYDIELTVPLRAVPGEDKPTNPTEPTEPTEPTDPTEPTEPTEPTDPTDPTEPTEPTEPTAPTEPAENPETPDGTTIPDAGIPLADDPAVTTIADEEVPLAGLVTLAGLLEELRQYEGIGELELPEDFQWADHEYAQAIYWGLQEELVVDTEDDPLDPEELLTLGLMREVLTNFVELYKGLEDFAVELDGEDEAVVADYADMVSRLALFYEALEAALEAKAA